MEHVNYHVYKQVKMISPDSHYLNYLYAKGYVANNCGIKFSSYAI